MDEHKGRSVAKQMGLAITGTIGILLQAYDEKMLSKAETELCLQKMFPKHIKAFVPVRTGSMMIEAVACCESRTRNSSFRKTQKDEKIISLGLFLCFKKNERRRNELSG